MAYELTDKVVVITGASQGIGAATAQLIAERGGCVVIVDFNPEGGEKTAAEIREKGGKADFVRTDVRNDAQVKAAFDFVKQKYGRLDKLICAAGVLKGPWLQPEEFPEDMFEMVLDVNIKGVFLCSKHAASLLEESGNGVMIVVASGAGVKGASSSLAYGASKGGANGLGMTLEGHLGPRGIRVNVICPGNIITDMKMSVDIAAKEKAGRPVEEAFEHAKQNYGTPDGIAKIIAFLISDEADYLRGTLFTR